MADVVSIASPYARWALEHVREELANPGTILMFVRISLPIPTWFQGKLIAITNPSGFSLAILHADDQDIIYLLDNMQQVP